MRPVPRPILAALSLVLGLVGPGLVPARATSASGDLFARAESVARILDGGGMEFDDESRWHYWQRSALHSLRDSLTSIARGLDAHLVGHPRDVRAILMRGRMLSLQYDRSSLDSTLVEPVKSGDDPRDSIVAVFARAVAIDSTAAEPRFWIGWNLARTFVVTSDTGRVEFEPRWKDALEPARAAHRLAPPDVRYRILAELCLLAAGDVQGAAAVRHAEGDDAFLADLLRRRSLVPEPPGARDHPVLRMIATERNCQEGGSDTNLVRCGVRVRVFTTEATPQAAVAFYESAFPGAHFVAGQPSGSLPDLGGVISMLEWDPKKGWRPADPDFIEKSEGQRGYGILILPTDALRAIGARPVEAARSVVWLEDFER